MPVGRSCKALIATSFISCTSVVLHNPRRPTPEEAARKVEVAGYLCFVYLTMAFRTRIYALLGSGTNITVDSYEQLRLFDSFVLPSNRVPRVRV